MNGFEATDSSAVFTGDLLETKPGFTANLTLEGTTILIQEDSVGKLQPDVFLLDHGSVLVGTSKSFRVRVNCITVVPVLGEWTQYSVSDLNGSIQVAARKLDVNVEHVAGGREKDSVQDQYGNDRPQNGNPENGHAEKTSPASAQPQDSHGGIVHETEQKNYNETELCGAPARPAQAGRSLNPKWIAGGAAGAGVLIWLLIHGGGGKTPLSSSQP